MKTFLALVFLSFKFCNVFAEAPPQGQLSVEGSFNNKTEKIF